MVSAYITRVLIQKTEGWQALLYLLVYTKRYLAVGGFSLISFSSTSMTQ